MIHFHDIFKKYIKDDVPQVDSSCLEKPFHNFAQHYCHGYSEMDDDDQGLCGEKTLGIVLMYVKKVYLCYTKYMTIFPIWDGLALFYSQFSSSWLCSYRTMST